MHLETWKYMDAIALDDRTKPIQHQQTNDWKTTLYIIYLFIVLTV